MQNGARYQAVLDLITEIFTAGKPADNVINDYIRARKYIGSKDRRAITEAVWDIIRNFRNLEFDAGSSLYRDILLLWLKNKNLLSGWGDSPYSLALPNEAEKQRLAEENEQPYPADVEAECPEWIFKKSPDMAFFKALNEPAPADFRINSFSRDEAVRRLSAEGLEAVPTPYSPIGLRSRERISLGNCMAYQEGLIDVQDESSQLAAILIEAKPEHKIIDYCCGAGGKSLALSYLLHGKGKILAHDANPQRLEALKPRMKRLNVKNIEITDFVATSDKDFDRFIVDAPCSGTGTWRRSPDAKFRLNPQMVEKLNKIQKEILDTAYIKTKSGGRIIYMTCSILKDENEDVISHFLNQYPDVKKLNIRQIWERNVPAPYPHSDDYMLRLSPYSSHTDGFFICVMEKL